MHLFVRIIFLLALFISVSVGAEDDFDFDLSGESISEDEEKKPSQKVTTDDVFKFFQDQAQVTIVTKRRQNVRDAPATVYVITEEQIRTRGYQFLHQALKDVPGIDFTWQGPGIYGITAMQRGQDTPEMNKTLVFIDGMLINNPSQGVPYINYTFGLYNVKQIEILWGPASALYGSNAYAGVINIVTKSGEDINNIAEITPGYVSFSQDAHPDGYYISGNIGKRFSFFGRPMSAIVSGHWIESRTGPSVDRIDLAGGYDTSYTTPLNVMAHPIYNTYAASAKFEYAGFTLGMRAWSYFTTQGYFATYRASSWPNAWWGFQGEEVYLRYLHVYSKKLESLHQIAFRQSRAHPGVPGKRGFDADRDAYGEETGGSLLWYRREDWALSVDNQATYNFSRATSSTLGVFAELAKVGNWNTNGESQIPQADGSGGYNYVTRYAQDIQGSHINNTIINEGTRPVDKPETQYNQINFAPYVQASHELFNQLILSAGGRLDIYRLRGIEGLAFACSQASASTTAANSPLVNVTCSDNEAGAQNYILFKNNFFNRDAFDFTTVSFSPRFGAVYKPNRQITTKVLLGWAFRNPTVRERYSPGSSRIPSGENLKPEKIRTLELGIGYKLLKSLYGEIDAYWSEAEDIIQLTATNVHRAGKDGDTALNSFQNSGRAHLLGFEVKVDAAIFSFAHVSVTAFANYSFQHHRYTSVVSGNVLSHDLSANGDKRNSTKMPRIADHKANLGFTMRFFKKLVFSPTMQWVGRRPQVITSPLESIDPYVLLNMNFGYHNILKGADFDVTIYNVLNTEANDPGVRDANGEYFTPIVPLPGFSLWARLKMRL